MGLLLHLLWIATALGVLIPSVADPDLWGHLLFGRLLLDGTLPSTNAFAYTTPLHPWVNHELLAEAAMATVFDAAGAPGLVAMKIVLGLGTLACIWHAARRRSGSDWAAAIATALAATVMAPGFMIRPQLFTLFFLALTLDALASADYRPAAGARLLPLLFALWVNTHGGVLAGVALVATGMVAAFAVDGARGRGSAGAALGLALFLALAGGALLVNPYGVTLLRFLLTDVTPRVPITEWAPVALGDASFPVFKLVALALGLWLALGRRAGLAESLVVAAATAAALLHRRHIPLFAIAAAPLLAACLADVAARVHRRWDVGAALPWLKPGTAAVAALQLALAGVAAWRDGGTIEVDARTYPVQAVRFLRQNGIVGNVALPFDWGEFALWSLPAGSKVAVDGRFTTAYPQPLLDQAWRFMTGGPGWDDLLTRHASDIVLADRRHAPAQLLRGHPEWEYVYSDPVSIVFLRKVPAQALALEQFHARTLVYDRAPLASAFPAMPRAEAGSGRLARVWRGS
jgi:hypothetical protein